MQAGTKVATLEQLLATRAKVTWPFRINFNMPTRAEVHKMYAWCETNAVGKWNASTEFADYFQFQDERDAVMFMLKFGGTRGSS